MAAAVAILGEAGAKLGEETGYKVGEEVARRLGKELGGEAGLAAGKLAGAKAAVQSAKEEASKVDAIAITDEGVTKLKAKVATVAHAVGKEAGRAAGKEAGAAIDIGAIVEEASDAARKAEREKLWK